MKKIIPAALILTGLAVLTSVFVPIISSQLSHNANESIILLDPMGGTVHASTNYGEAGSWFEGQAPLEKTITQSKISYYTLSIPRLKLNDVTVQINGTDLFKNAIQYPGTALPGTYGNTVIFGHSTIPQLYKVGNPLSIFNPLLKIKVGDEINIYYDGISYRYIVKDTAEIKPTQIDVLAQHYDKYQLTLITCTPLGTYLYRFVVHAELVN